MPSVTFNVSSHSLHRSRFNTGTTTSFIAGSYAVCMKLGLAMERKKAIRFIQHKVNRTRTNFLPFCKNAWHERRREGGERETTAREAFIQMRTIQRKGGSIWCCWRWGDKKLRKHSVYSNRENFPQQPFVPGTFCALLAGCARSETLLSISAH